MSREERLAEIRAAARAAAQAAPAPSKEWLEDVRRLLQAGTPRCAPDRALVPRLPEAS